MSPVADGENGVRPQVLMAMYMVVLGRANLYRETKQDDVPLPEADAKHVQVLEKVTGALDAVMGKMQLSPTSLTNPALQVNDKHYAFNTAYVNVVGHIPGIETLSVTQVMPPCLTLPKPQLIETYRGPDNSIV